MTISGLTWGAVALGGAIGAVARFGLGLAFLRALGPAFPYGTLSANAAGSFAMGLLATSLMTRSLDDPARAFFAIGLLGAFTTFSSFSFEAFALARDRSLMIAGGYVVASVALSLGGLCLGVLIARRFWGTGA